MAIGTGDAIEKFGTQAVITNAGVTISSGAMSTQGDAVAWINSDDAPDADFVLEATFAVAPNSTGTVKLFARKLNVRAANDENIPSITNNEDILVASFGLDSSTINQVKTTRGTLPNGKSLQEYEFYLKNDGGQNISGCQAWITPIASGPAP